MQIDIHCVEAARIKIQVSQSRIWENPLTFWRAHLSLMEQLRLLIFDEFVV